jgi:Hsp90 protein
VQEAEEGDEEVEVDQTVRIHTFTTALHTLHHCVGLMRCLVQQTISSAAASSLCLVHRLIANLACSRVYTCCYCVDMQDDKYLKFYEQFGRNIKMGITEDATNRK